MERRRVVFKIGVIYGTPAESRQGHPFDYSGHR
jgi:hypothetical protein